MTSRQYTLQLSNIMSEFNPQLNINEGEFNLTSYWQNVASVSTFLNRSSEDLTQEQTEVQLDPENQEDNLAELWKNVGKIATALKETNR